MTNDAFQQFKDEASKAVRDALARLGVDIPVSLDRAPEGMGDLAFPCFPLANILKKAPDAIARDIASRIATVGMVEKVTASGGYINFSARFDALARLSTTRSRRRRGTGREKRGPRGYCWSTRA